MKIVPPHQAQKNVQMLHSSQSAGRIPAFSNEQRRKKNNTSREEISTISQLSSKNACLFLFQILDIDVQNVMVAPR